RAAAVRARPDRAGPRRGGGLRHHRRRRGPPPVPARDAGGRGAGRRAGPARRAGRRGRLRAALGRRGRGMSASLRAELRRTNFAGRRVSLLEGALVVGGVTVLATRTGRTADAAVLAGIGALGLIDDVWEPRQRRAGRPVSKGLRGHLGALRSGRLTTGAAKALGIPLLALGGAAAAPGPRRGAVVLAEAALVAGSANLANLLDLRPGRALKAVLPGAVVLAAAPGGDPRDESGRRLGLAAALPALLALPADLREHGMLGDAGA